MKYMGSKRRIVKHILPIMLYSYNGNTFVDAFCGGCSVIQNVPSSYKRIANDNNKYLIAMWKSLMAGKKFPTHIGKPFYDEIRDCVYGRIAKYQDDLIGWVGFMASFNGRFVDSGYSGHDVKGRDYIGENIKNTLSQVPFLNGVEFYARNYDELLLPKQSIIYCDPPYKGTKQYATSKDFDHEKFYQWCREKKSEGHTIFVSEYEMPDDFKCVWQMDVKTAQNPHKTKLATEKLFTL